MKMDINIASLLSLLISSTLFAACSTTTLPTRDFSSLEKASVGTTHPALDSARQALANNELDKAERILLAADNDSSSAILFGFAECYMRRRVYPLAAEYYAEALERKVFSMTDRIDFWLYGYNNVKDIYIEIAMRNSSSADEDQGSIEGNIMARSKEAWEILIEGFREDEIAATRLFLEHQPYYQVYRTADTGYWEVDAPVTVAPTVNIKDLYNRFDSSMAANKVSQEGLVLVHVVIDEQGRPQEAEVYLSSSNRLSTEALYTAMGTRFTPAFRNGQPVSTRITVPLYFPE